jgi:uncharacterized Tic20 family protein
MSASEASEPEGNGVPADERTWGMLAHLAALLGLLIPLANIFGPLAVWLTRRDQSRFVADQAKEALNFNITVAFGVLVCYVLTWLLIGILLFVALVLYWLAMTIVAAIRASEGIRYHYPFAVRLVT